jgi:hypothetical protein
MSDTTNHDPIGWVYSLNDDRLLITYINNDHAVGIRIVRPILWVNDHEEPGETFAEVFMAWDTFEAFAMKAQQCIAAYKIRTAL